MALQDDLAGAVSAISNQISLEDAAVAQFVKDVTTLIQSQGNPALISGVQAAITKLNTAAAIAATDTATVTTTDTAVQGALPPAVTAVQIAPSPLNLVPGASVTATAVALNGTAPASPVPSFAWSFPDATVATVAANTPNSTALVTATNVGTAVLTVVAGGQTATVTVTVALPVVVTPPGGAVAAPAVAGSANVGNAAIVATPTATAVAETITILFTDPNDFTVTGSVSGSLGTGTVGTPFTSSVIGFTLTAGSTANVSGDSYTIAVTLAAVSTATQPTTAPFSTSAARPAFTPRRPASA